VTLSRTGREFVETIAAVKAIEERLDRRATMPARVAERRTAFLWSHDVYWDLEIQPRTTEWNAWAHRNTYTEAVKSAGAPLDFVAEGDDFERCPFLVAPAYQLVPDSLAARWRQYAERGGHLVLTCRSGQKNALGRGTVTMIGVSTDDGALERELVREV
jgi:beta-galactosidase